MAIPASHYDALGVAPTATAAEIRRAYLDLARRHHPDRMGDAPAAERAQAAARMARINEAWAVLGHPDRRAGYDAGRREGSRPTSNVRDPGATFEPFPETEDHLDPRLLDDAPTGARTFHRSLAFLPAGFAVIGVVLCVFGAMLGFVGVLGVGLVSLALSALSFLAVPLIALANSSRADRE